MKRPNQETAANKPGAEDSLRAMLRGEALIHVGQIDQQVSLDPDRLLKLSWLASELAAHLEGHA